VPKITILVAAPRKTILVIHMALQGAGLRKKFN